MAKELKKNGEVKIDSLLGLINQQEKPIRDLFAKALNFYVSPGAGAVPEAEKLDQLRKAIQDSLK